MPQQIIDFDAIAPAPKQARIHGKLYQLPGDIPAELFVSIQREAERQQQAADAGEEIDNAGTILDLHDQVLELFRVHEPEMSQLPPLSLSQLVSFISLVYGGDQSGGDAEADAAPPSRGGTRSTPARRPARKSRS